MQKSQPWFRLFAYSGIIVLLGLVILITVAISVIRAKPGAHIPSILTETRPG
jgi:hypothetical protein